MEGPGHGEETMVPSTRVILWTAPRCTSSVFERSVREISEVKVLYEPHLWSYYYGPERKTDFSLSEAMQRKHAIHTYDYADEKLLADYNNHSAVFAKNMAYYIENERFSHYVKGRFSTFQHTFLIRNPRASIPSQWKASMKSGFSHPLEENGYSRLYELFEFIQSKEKHVIVINSEDLMKNPERIMEQYCGETGLPYNEKMLTWSPGIVQDWTEYKYYKEWHWNAMYSSGFNKDVKKGSKVEESFPSIVEEEIQRALPYYEALYKYRMT